MKRILLLLFTFHLSLFTSTAQTQHFYTSDQLSSNQITHIRQDRTGYIWVGTEYGLNKYDGYRFTNYLHDPGDKTSLRSNVISFLFVDEIGTLWVGTQKGLDRYDDVNDQFEHVTLHGAKAEPRINHIVQEDDQHLLVGTAGYGLFRLDTKTCENHQLEGYAKSDTNYFSHIFIDTEGAFWNVNLFYQGYHFVTDLHGLLSSR